MDNLPTHIGIIKVEANEGIWVEKPTTPSSCFTTSNPVATYVRNPNMDIYTCVNKLTEMGANESLQEGETLEAYCNGTGTVDGGTLQYHLDSNWFYPSQLTELETAGIIIPNTTPVQANVTEIGENSFENKNLTSVVIPNSVITIGESAFEYNQLTKVDIPDGTTTIGEAAFKGNLSLEEVIVSDELYTTLADGCHSGVFNSNIFDNSGMILKNRSNNNVCKHMVQN